MSQAMPHPSAGLLRRLAAAAYDLLILGGLLMALGFGVIVIRGGAAVPPGNPLFQLLILAVITLFFVGSWSRGGQTPGMRAWRLRLESHAGLAVDWRTAILRLGAAALSLGALGLGFLWILVDRDRQAWHDRLTGTRMTVIPKTGAGPLSASAPPSPP
jgi:uncharacterized RDD family membrane protein YckC